MSSHLLKSVSNLALAPLVVQKLHVTKEHMVAQLCTMIRRLFDSMRSFSDKLVMESILLKERLKSLLVQVTLSMLSCLNTVSIDIMVMQVISVTPVLRGAYMTK